MRNAALSSSSMNPRQNPRRRGSPSASTKDVLERFYILADDSGTGYQTLVNHALREYIDGKAPKFEETLRRIVREEIAHSQS
jgi:hypothetical protein